VHEDVNGEAAILSHQRPLRLEGHHLAVGAEGGVQAAQLNAGLGPITAHACPDGALGRPVMDEDVGVEVAVADDQVVGVRGERHQAAVAADRGRRRPIGGGGGHVTSWRMGGSNSNQG
jgi:hypothetical protein